MRIIAGAIMILAGLLGLGLGEVARAIRGRPQTYNDAIVAGGIVLTLGAVLVAWEFKDAVKQYLRTHDLAAWPPCGGGETKLPWSRGAAGEV